jgi:hypothetical protein
MLGLVSTERVKIPAICDNCGTVFSSGFSFGVGSRPLVLIGASPCPDCGGFPSKAASENVLKAEERLASKISLGQHILMYETPRPK